MTIERETHLYEILLRFNSDGYQGSHVIDLEIMTENGAVISERELPARSITEAEVGGIIGQQSARLVEAADAAIAQAAESDRARQVAEDAAIAQAAKSDQARQAAEDAAARSEEDRRAALTALADVEARLAAVSAELEKAPPENPE